MRYLGFLLSYPTYLFSKTFFTSEFPSARVFISERAGCRESVLTLTVGDYCEGGSDEEEDGWEFHVGG